jgi:hypothetical protein
MRPTDISAYSVRYGERRKIDTTFFCGADGFIILQYVQNKEQSFLCLFVFSMTPQDDTNELKSSILGYYKSLIQAKATQTCTINNQKVTRQ